MKFLKCLLFTAFTFSVLLSSPRVSAQVQYFGFWADAMRDTGSGNYINETASVSNVHFISAPFESEISDEWRTKVLAAKNNDNPSILMIEGMMFEWATLSLSPNREEYLKGLKNKLVGLESSILGIYLIDEPYWKNTLYAKILPEAEVFKNLKEAVALIKKYFPNVIIMTTEAAPMIKKGGVRFPAEVDWIGANCYLWYAECQTTGELEKLYDNLVANFTPNQQIVFTLDGAWYDKATVNTATELKLIERNNFILSIAGKYKVAGFFPYIYQSFVSSHENMTGTRDMPKVKDYLFKLGTSVIRGSYKHPDLCVKKEPKCEYPDYVRRDSCGKELERWRHAPQPYCLKPIPATPAAPAPGTTPSDPNCKILEPKCEAPDYVRRDSCGKEIERWKNAPAPFCPKPGAPVIAAPTSPSPAAPVAPANGSCKVLEPTCEGKDSVRRDSCGKEIERWKNAPEPYCPKEGAPVAAAPASPANPAVQTCTVLEPTCEAPDYVRRDSCGKEIERWKNAPAPYCPQACTVLEPVCDGKDYVRRDSCGKEIERWKNAPKPYCP